MKPKHTHTVYINYLLPFSITKKNGVYENIIEETRTSYTLDVVLDGRCGMSQLMDALETLVEAKGIESYYINPKDETLKIVDLVFQTITINPK